MTLFRYFGMTVFRFIVMTLLFLNGLSFFSNVKSPHFEAGLNGEEARAEDNHLTFGKAAEVGKPRGNTRARLVEQGIDGADKGVVTVVYVVLIRFEAVVRRSGVQPADLHDGDVLLKGDIGGVAFVVEPVGTNDSDGILVTFHPVDDFGTLLYGSDVAAVDGCAP